MAKTSLRHYAAALIVLLATATLGKADMILWSYQSGAVPTSIVVSGGLHTPTATLILGGSPTTQEHDSATAMVVHMLTTGSHLNFQNASTTLGLDIKDHASHAQHMFAFPAVFNGTADVPTHSSNVTLSFPSGMSQSFVIGNNRYTVTIGPIQPLAWTAIGANFPGRNAFFGEVDAHVTVSPANTAATPEPSTLALAGMGVLTLAGAAWQARRRARLQAV
jgi:hypothetical protein